jgi:hypothetical protein
MKPPVCVRAHSTHKTQHDRTSAPRATQPLRVSGATEARLLLLGALRRRGSALLRLPRQLQACRCRTTLPPHRCKLGRQLRPRGRAGVQARAEPLTVVHGLRQLDVAKVAGAVVHVGAVRGADAAKLVHRALRAGERAHTDTHVCALSVVCAAAQLPSAPTRSSCGRRKTPSGACAVLPHIMRGPPTRARAAAGVRCTHHARV